jgi:hypothetical protein
LDASGDETLMTPRRLAALVALCGTVALAGWVVAGLGGSASSGVKNADALPIAHGGATSVARSLTVGAGPVDAVPEAATPAVANVPAADITPAESVALAFQSLADIPMAAPALATPGPALAPTPLPDVPKAAAATAEATAAPAPAPTADVSTADGPLAGPAYALASASVAGAPTAETAPADAATAPASPSAADVPAADTAPAEPAAPLAPASVADAPSVPAPAGPVLVATADPELRGLAAGEFASATPVVVAAAGSAPVTIAAGANAEPPMAAVEIAETPVGEATADPPPPGPQALAGGAEVPVSAPSADAGPRPDKPMRLVSLFTSDPPKEYLKPAARSIETLNECLVAEICIDDYLWALYERTPKVDTNRLLERVKVTVKKKGKIRTVTKVNAKYVIGDFTWKDPIAAQRAGMSLKDYVIGGMDRAFKLKLYRAVRVMEDAGYMPGITSAFRDDYRQSIAVGNKAASDSSYHGGSRRGGYGHGLAADLVSVKGETRMQRYAASEELWKWIDAHEKELGVGRPYLDRDPPHVGPTDGKEYADKRGRATLQKVARQSDKAQQAAAKTKIAQKPAPEAKTTKATKPQAKTVHNAVPQPKAGQKTAAQAKTAQRPAPHAKTAQNAKLETKKRGLAARNDPSAAKRDKPAKSKVSSLQTRASVQR